MDALAEGLLARVKSAMVFRPELTRREFGRRIGRSTPSWVSEFFAGKRTTNDLRLVVRMAKVLSVPVAYLLGEGPREQDPETIALLSAFQDLEGDARARTAVLQLALSLRPKLEGTDDQHAGAQQSDGRNRRAIEQPRKARHR